MKQVGNPLCNHIITHLSITDINLLNRQRFADF